jgi:hypothetical protein
MKKVLLDENMPVKLKNKLIGYEVYTVRDKKWNSLKNSSLLAKAEENKFDVFITTDKNLPFQQNIAKLSLAVVILDIVLLKWSHIEPIIPRIIEVLPTVENGKAYIVK